MTSAPSQASVSVMEVPASNCVRSITLMPAKAGCAMACVCGIASMSHTSSISRQRERPTPYTFLQGLVGRAKAGRPKCKSSSPARMALLAARLHQPLSRTAIRFAASFAARARPTRVQGSAAEPSVERGGWLQAKAQAADAVVNAASRDHRGAVEALIAGLSGSGKPLIHSSGSSIVADLAMGEPSDRIFHEATPIEPHADKAARVAIDRLVLAASGIR